MRAISSRDMARQNTTQVYKAQPISGVIITHNVAHVIRPCLEALNQVCNEVIVLDSFSDDGTVEICQEMGVKLVPQEWLGYSQTKNLGNGMATNDWILSIDADEVLSPELIAALKNLVLEEGKVYSLDRLTNYCGTWIRHCGWYPDWKIRLFNRQHVQWQGDFVHETLSIPPGFREQKLTGKLFHYSYADSDDHFRRIEKYARLAAQEQYAKGKKASFAKLYLSPLARFFKTYVLKLGFLDGKAGWQISIRNAYMIRRRYRILQSLWNNNTNADDKQ